MPLKTFARIALASAALFALVGPAAADTIGVLMKNTLTLTDSQGGVTTAWFSADGHMKQTDSSGMHADGAWAMEGTRLCWTARGKARICIPLEDGKDVGDSWEVKGPTGQAVGSLAIVEGRSGENGAEKTE
jgi:hypothetical protein